MEIRCLNNNFELVGKAKLSYFDLAWDRKYYESGQFSVQIKKNDYSTDMSYVFTSERPELGVIEGVHYSDETNTVVLSGFFYERKLSDKIIYPTFFKSDTRAGYVAAAVAQFKDDIPKLQVAPYADDGEVVEKQVTGSNLEEMAHSTLRVEEKSYRCKYDFENDIVSFEIYQGKNRTQGQYENNFVTFSKGFRNLKNVSSKEDSSNFKNCFIVGGSGEGSERVYVTVDLSEGGYKRQLFIDCRDEQYTPDSQTLEQYKGILRQRAMEKARDYVDIHNITFDVDANKGAVYLKDYDIGDKCDIIIDDIQKSYEARIIEILETWSSGKHQVMLTFGEKIPTPYEKARLR